MDNSIEVLLKLDFGENFKNRCLFQCERKGHKPSGRYFRFGSGNVYEACTVHADGWKNSTRIIEITKDYE